jgi:hypothetical protein
MVYAQSLYDVAENKVEIKRSFIFTRERFEFPVTAGGHYSDLALGFEYFVAANAQRWQGWCERGEPVHGRSNGWLSLEKLCRAKTSDLQNLCRHIEQSDALRDVRLG